MFYILYGVDGLTEIEIDYQYNELYRYNEL